LSSSRAAKLFPALSFEDSWSTVRTIKLVPPGMVTARAEKGVSKTQIRLKEKTVAYLIIFVMGEVAGFLRTYWLSSNLWTKLKPCAPYLVVQSDSKYNFWPLAWIVSGHYSGNPWFVTVLGLCFGGGQLALGIVGVSKLSRRPLVRTDAADMLKRRLKQADSPTTKLYDRRGQKVLLEDTESIRY
jgi:hypothetical protein